MGRHINADAEVDELVEQTRARHAQAAGGLAGHPLEQQTVISADTHVGSGFDGIAAGTPDAAPSPANPGALIQHGLVGDGTELE